MKSLVLIVLCSMFLGSSAYLLNYYVFLELEVFDKSQSPFERKIGALCLNEDVRPGDILSKNKLSWCRPPDDTNSKHYLTKDAISIADLSNIVLTEFVAKGTFLTKNKFLHPHEQGYLGFLLGDDTRAKSVSISNIEDYVTVLHRGDYVDLLFAYKNPVSARKIGEVAVKTLVKNVRVLGIKGDYGQALQGTLSSSNQKKGQLTLALSSRQAELLTVAEQIGTLSILLRSPANYITQGESFPREEGSNESDLIGYASIPENGTPVTSLSKIRISRGSKTTIIDRPRGAGRFQHVGLK
jgi:pilus assembly protein CpaB